MKLRTTFTAVVFTIVCLLAGCASDEQSNAGYSKVDPIPSETAMETSQSNDAQSSETNTANTNPNAEDRHWNWTSSGDGENTASITEVTIVNSAEGLVETGFMEDAFVCVYNGNFAERREYTYPDFINEDGSFAAGVRLIVADVVVENPMGATNRWKNDSGEYENHYSDPYIFNVSSVCSLIHLNQAKVYDGVTQCATSGCSYFSLRDTALENGQCFSLKPNATLTFQVGYLIGNNYDGSNIELDDLAIGLSGSLNDPWFSLQMRENNEELY